MSPQVLNNIPHKDVQERITLGQGSRFYESLLEIQNKTVQGFIFY